MRERGCFGVGGVRDEQCDKIGPFFSGPNIWIGFGQFYKKHFSSKNRCGYCLDNFCTNLGYFYSKIWSHWSDEWGDSVCASDRGREREVLKTWCWLRREGGLSLEALSWADWYWPTHSLVDFWLFIIDRVTNKGKSLSCDNSLWLWSKCNFSKYLLLNRPIPCLFFFYFQSFSIK